MSCRYCGSRSDLIMEESGNRRVLCTQTQWSQMTKDNGLAPLEPPWHNCPPSTPLSDFSLHFRSRADAVAQSGHQFTGSTGWGSSLLLWHFTSIRPSVHPDTPSHLPPPSHPSTPESRVWYLSGCQLSCGFPTGMEPQDVCLITLIHFYKQLPKSRCCAGSGFQVAPLRRQMWTSVICGRGCPLSLLFFFFFFSPGD